VTSAPPRSSKRSICLSKLQRRSDNRMIAGGVQCFAESALPLDCDAQISDMTSFLNLRISGSFRL
jgi:hypothetical protein